MTKGDANFDEENHAMAIHYKKNKDDLYDFFIFESGDCRRVITEFPQHLVIVLTEFGRGRAQPARPRPRPRRRRSSP